MRKVLCLVLALCSARALEAQSLPLLLIQSDPAAAGTAGASAQTCVSAFAIDNNAAAMSLSGSKLEAGAVYGTWQPSVANDNILGASAYWHSGKLGAGIGFKSLKMPSYEIVSNNGVVSQVDGEFSPQDRTISLGGSYAMSETLAIGLVCKISSSSLAKDAAASVFGSDISVQYAKEGVSAGLVLANIGGKVKYKEDEYPQPMIAKAGVSYSLIDGLTASGCAEYLFEGAFGASVGAEYCYAGMAFARAGYHIGSKELGIPSYASLGAGGKIAGVSLNVAYLLASETIGGSFLAGLSYSF